MSLALTRRSRLLAAAGIGLVAALAFAGCSTTSGGGSSASGSSPTTGSSPTGDSSSTAAASACKKSDGPVTLQYWTWGAGYKKAADLWNSTHPDVQVKFSEIPTGNAGGYQKMTNAVQAGTAPDVGFLEFDTIPAFHGQDAIINIADCLDKSATADFVPSVWSQVTLGEKDAVYALPIGSGPMALYYRADLLKKYDITVPKTWDEFAAAAEKVHKADPTVYLANFPLNSPNWFTGMVSQAGSQWFSADGSSWTVSMDGADSKKVASYWQKLVDEGSVSTLPDFSPEWNSAVASGKLLTWPSAVWGAGVVKAAAPDQAGDWAVAQLPNWGTSSVSASWGGGGLSVLKGSKHPYEAAQFALWMATDPGALKILNTEVGIYPTTNTLLSNSIFTSPDAYFGGQKIFDEFKTATANLPNFTWGPDMSDTYAAISDALAQANQAGSRDYAGALTKAQDKVTATLKQKGISVK